MRWYESIADKLVSERIYTRAELVELLKTDYPYVSPNSYTWAVSDLVTNRTLIKVGYNQYLLPTQDEKPTYAPHYSNIAKELISSISSRFPNVTFIIIETNLLNEFLISPISPNIIIVQVQRGMDEGVFRFLQEQRFPGLLYKPTKKYFDFYKADNSIIIENLVTESPVSSRNPHEVCIEKLLVDLFCNKYIAWMYDVGGFPDAMKTVAEKYLIDKPRLLRYATRRGKKDDFTLAIPELVNAALVRDAKSHREYTLIQSAADIINTLPRSQQELYIDINGGKQTQADMARYYQIIPQAVTNRIGRLYRTVSRRLQEEYGFTEAEIRKVGKGNASSFFRNIPRQDTNI